VAVRQIEQKGAHSVRATGSRYHSIIYRLPAFHGVQEVGVRHQLRRALDEPEKNRGALQNVSGCLPIACLRGARSQQSVNQHRRSHYY
jgi:hypothetical protein